MGRRKLKRKVVVPDTTHSLAKFGIPNELLQKMVLYNYQDREAKVRQQFRVLFVNKWFYNCFNEDNVWKGLFALYYIPNDKIPIDFMKKTIINKHSLKNTYAVMTKIIRKHKIGFDKEKGKYTVKSNQIHNLYHKESIMQYIQMPQEFTDTRDLIKKKKNSIKSMRYSLPRDKMLIKADTYQKQKIEKRKTNNDDRFMLC